MRGFFDFTLETSEDKLVFDGGIYNFEELKRELTGRGIFIVKGDVPEICLKGYRRITEKTSLKNKRHICSSALGWKRKKGYTLQR